ncbi:phospholipase D-like domain-containing protein [Roseomonas sp. KE2513]|uniref:phospholipase D-like domain-containing protein n=1 Tax=Roseomonas sp. KE2513 TaxID=2479202 RepID=UPI0018DF8EF5|nr:phospholipase D-like domain-containing protein [Roseomonas sp. KE2513]
MAVIIDAAEYFLHLKAAILQARHSILLVGWDFDARIELDRSGRAPASIPNRIGSLLDYAVRCNPGLRVYVLRWDLAFLKMPFRGTTPFFLLEWLGRHRLHFHLDRHHPPGGCHHQKIAVIDDALAFCGGIDVTGGRWDTSAHRDDEPARLWPNGTPHGPWHDVTTAVTGEAARALGDLARDRWFAANGWKPDPPPIDHKCWPEELDAVFHDVSVAIARSQPAYDGQPEVREIEALYLAAIASARHSIYLESQYFSAHRISEALERRLAEPDGPEVVIVNPDRAQGWLEEEVMGAGRALLLGRLREADLYGRLRFCTPVTAGGAAIYVHAKVLVVDDTLLRIGSSNINNRSMGVDTECDLAVEVRPEDARAPQLRAAILRVRDSLLAEHLGVGRDEFQAAFQAAGGSLVRTLDRLARPSGPTLVPFHPPELSEAERELAETHALDPHRPEAMAETFIRALRLLPPVRVAVAAALVAVGASVAAWYWQRAGRRPGRRIGQ